MAGVSHSMIAGSSRIVASRPRPPKLRNEDPRPTAETAKYAPPAAARNGRYSAVQAGRDGQDQPTRPRGPTRVSESTPPNSGNCHDGSVAVPSYKIGQE